MTCLMTPSLPAASIPCSTTSSAQRSIGIEALLQVGEALDVIRQHRFCGVLVEPAGVGGIERRKAEMVGIVNA